VRGRSVCHRRNLSVPRGAVDGLTMGTQRQYQLLSKLVGTWGAASLAVVCLAACSVETSVSAPRSTSPVTLTVGFPYPAEEDPSRGVRQAARLASLEGLTTQSINGQVVPRLAEGWSESPDGLTWTIRLRPAAVFHDGSVVDAPAVKGSLEAYLKSAAGRSSPGLQDIVAIEASKPFVLTLRLKQRSSLLLDDLEAPISKVDEKGSIVGTGPYVVSSTSTNEVAMTAFRQYYGGIPSVERLVWRLYPTVRTAWAATMRGEVDFLYEVGPESREFLQSERSVALYSFLRNYISGVVFNIRRPMFRDPEVRKALSYAVDRATIVQRAFYGHGTVANGPVWPLHWAYDPAVPGYTYDPARAAASLNKAIGPGRQTAGLQSSNLSFVCLIPENFQLWERLALMVQRDLAEIGVNMELEAVPAEKFSRRLTDGDFDVVLMEMISGFSVSRPFAFWHSSGLHRFSGYQNESVDSALEDIRRADGDTEYRQAFGRFQKAIFDDPPAIFLAWGETARAVSRRFDVVKAPGGDIRMSIGDWKLAGEAAN
jgi:peptide/nickel transport system substrate-binding protein